MIQYIVNLMLVTSTHILLLTAVSGQNLHVPTVLLLHPGEVKYHVILLSILLAHVQNHTSVVAVL